MAKNKKPKYIVDPKHPNFVPPTAEERKAMGDEFRKKYNVGTGTATAVNKQFLIDTGIQPDASLVETEKDHYLVIPSTEKEYPSGTIGNIIQRIEAKKHNPYQPKYLGKGVGRPQLSFNYNDEILNDHADYIDYIRKSGVTPIDENGRPIQTRDEYYCESYSQCHSGGDFDYQYYYDAYSDLNWSWNIDIAAGNDAFEYNSDIGDNGYWSGYWFWHDIDTGRELCKRWCAGTTTHCSGVEGPDGQMFYPIYDGEGGTDGDYTIPPNSGCGYYNICGTTSVHPEDCNEYSVIWSSWAAVEVGYNGCCDTYTKCACYHHRAFNVVTNMYNPPEDYASWETVENWPQVGFCNDPAACNYLGSYNVDEPIYSWCIEGDHLNLGHCIENAADCRYECYGCTDATSTNFDELAEKSCNGNHGPGGDTPDCVGHNCCCEYNNIKTTANTFKLTYTWDDVRVKLWGDRYLNDELQQHVFWTGQINTTKGDSIDWSQYAPGWEGNVNLDGLFLKTNDSFWLKWAKHTEVCFDPNIDNAFFGTENNPITGAHRCCEGTDCGWDVNCGDGDAIVPESEYDDEGLPLSIYNKPSGDTTDCVHMVKVDVHPDIQESSGMMKYTYTRQVDPSSGGFIYVNPLFGLDDTNVEALPWITWSIDESSSEQGQVDDIVIISSAYEGQWSMDFILDNAGTFKTWNENKPYDFQYGEYVINAPSGMFRRPGRDYYEGIYEIDTSDAEAGIPVGYCEDWNGNQVDLCGKFKLSFCNNEIDYNVDELWSGTDDIFNTDNENIWKDRNRTGGESWYYALPGEGFDNGPGYGPCRSYTTLPGGPEENHYSVSNAVLYDRPEEIPNSGWYNNDDELQPGEDSRFKWGHCNTTPVNSFVKTFEGYFPLDINNLLDVSHMISGPLTGIVYDGGGIDGKRRTGRFKSGCIGPHGGCFNCNNIPSKLTCGEHWSTFGCEWSGDILTGACSCVDSEKGCCTGDEVPKIASCTSGQDDFNLCMGDQSNAFESNTNQPDGDFSNRCASLNYDSIFLYNTGTILDGRKNLRIFDEGSLYLEETGGREFEIPSWKSGFSNQWNWNPGIVAHGPKTTIEEYSYEDRDLRRLNGNFDNMYRNDHVKVGGVAQKYDCFDYYDNLYEELRCNEGTWTISDNAWTPDDPMTGEGDYTHSGTSTGMLQFGNKRKNLMIPQMVKIDVNYGQGDWIKPTVGFYGGCSSEYMAAGAYVSREECEADGHHMCVENQGCACGNESNPCKCIGYKANQSVREGICNDWFNGATPTGNYEALPANVYNGLGQWCDAGNCDKGEFQNSCGGSGSPDWYKWIECEGGDHNMYTDSYTVNIQLLGEHNHQDSNYGNKWYGIDNKTIGDTGVFKHRFTDEILQGGWLYGDGTLTTKEVCRLVEPHGYPVDVGDVRADPYCFEDMCNEWACTWDVSNEEHNVHKWYLLKSVYNLPSSYDTPWILDAYGDYDGQIADDRQTDAHYYWMDSIYHADFSLMNYTIYRGGIAEMIQEHYGPGGILEGMELQYDDYPSHWMPYCANESYYMPNCDPAEWWDPQRWHDSCYNPGMGKLLDETNEFWKESNMWDDTSATDHGYWADRADRADAGRDIMLSANKYTVDLLCQSMGFDAGKVLSWTNSASGCYSGFRRIMYEPYISDGSNPYSSDIPKLFTPRGQANIYNLQGDNRNQWPTPDHDFYDEYESTGEWYRTPEQEGLRGLSDYIFGDGPSGWGTQSYQVGGRSGFFCPYGPAIRPEDIACYKHDIWSPAQNHMYGEARHNNYQPKCDSFYSKDDFLAWFKAYYWSYWEREITWKDAYEHPLFGEEVPYYVAVGDAENNSVRECGPEIIVLPAQSFVRQNPDSEDTGDGQAYYPGIPNGMDDTIDSWNKSIHGVPFEILTNDLLSRNNNQDYAFSYMGNTTMIVLTNPDRSCGECPSGEVCNVSLYNGSKCLPSNEVYQTVHCNCSLDEWGCGNSENNWGPFNTGTICEDGVDVQGTCWAYCNNWVGEDPDYQGAACGGGCMYPDYEEPDPPADPAPQGLGTNHLLHFEDEILRDHNWTSDSQILIDGEGYNPIEPK
jgi:hypothetical protein